MKRFVSAFVAPLPVCTTSALAQTAPTGYHTVACAVAEKVVPARVGTSPTSDRAKQ